MLVFVSPDLPDLRLVPFPSDVPTVRVLLIEQKGKHHSIQSRELGAAEIGLRSGHDAIFKHVVRRLSRDLVVWENVLLDRADDVSVDQRRVRILRTIFLFGNAEVAASILSVAN